MRPKILTVGSAYFAMDMEISTVPPIGGTSKVKEYERYPDGSGICTAVALEKLDTESVLVSSVGSDSGGRTLSKFLSTKLFNNSYIFTLPHTAAGTRWHMDDVEGDRRSFQYDGANLNLTVDMVDDAFSCCPDGAIINGDMPQELVYSTILASNAHRIPVLVNLMDPSSARLPLEQFGDGTILVMSEENARKYCNMRVETVDDCLKACISLAGKVKAKYFVIRMEDKGAFAYNGKYYYFVPNYDIEPTDKRGSVEYYNAALLLRYMLEPDIRIACEFAAVSETVAMLRSGGAGNLPTYGDIQKFVVENELDERLLV